MHAHMHSHIHTHSGKGGCARGALSTLITILSLLTTQMANEDEQTKQNRANYPGKHHLQVPRILKSTSVVLGRHYLSISVSWCYHRPTALCRPLTLSSMKTKSGTRPTLPNWPTTKQNSTPSCRQTKGSALYTRGWIRPNKETLQIQLPCSSEL